MIKAIIIEDEKEGRIYLEGMLNEYIDNVIVVGSADNVIDGVKLINKEKPDLVFLDINLKSGSGFDVIEMINDDTVKIIFTTAYKEHAIRAHKVNQVHDYLLKPIDLDDLEESLARLKKSNVETVPNLEKIKIPTKDGFQLIAIEDILFVRGEGSYAEVVWIGNNKLFASLPLKHFEDSLPSDFLKCHKSYIINKNMIEQFSKTDGYKLILKENHEIPVARRSKNDILDSI